MTAELPSLQQGGNSLAEALLALQADLPTVSKRQTAIVKTKDGSYSYKFAGLAAVMSAVLPKLNALGLIFTARPTVTDGRPLLLCELVHVGTGERLTAEYPLATTAAGPAQAVGSAISYGRRYCLTSMIGLVCEEDDDGRAASARYDEPPEREPARRAPRRQPETEPTDEGPRLISGGQTTKLHTLLTAAGHRERDARLRFCSEAVDRALTSTAELTLREAARLISDLERARDEKGSGDA